MSGNHGKTPDKPPTPQEQVKGQVALTNAAQTAMGIVHGAFGFGPDRVFQYGQRTDFEKHDLNVMLDLVEDAKPSDLENAGSALWKASKAMSDAATELRSNIKHASDDFQGEAGTAFQKWGHGLADHTDALSTYVQSAGVEIAAAASGLAQVKSSMPPRDTRPVDQQKMRPSQYPAHQQNDNNPEYQAAVKVEGHRQEAINQMNRLSSFYSVSSEGLSKLDQHAPTFEAMPHVGVPQPDPQYGTVTHEHGGGASAPGGHPGASMPAVHHSTQTPPSSETQTPSPKEVHGRITTPHSPVGTEIDSVDTLPRPPVSTPGPQEPVTLTGPNASGGPTSPLPTGFPGPTTGQTVRGLGGAGTRRPFTSQGRAGASETAGASRSGLGRGSTNDPLGRAGAGRAATGRAGTEGENVSRGGAQGGRPTSTARGVTGGTARANTVKSVRPSGPGATGASRENGVVGGRPSSAKGTGQTGSRIPRGTVMGDEGSGNAQGNTARISQRGVIGAQGSESASRSSSGGRKIQGTSEAVTGRSTERNSGARAGRKGFTPGGEGLVRGGSTRGGRDEGGQDGAQRPDYLVEDEETHLPHDRRSAPPVVD
ncbi:hypothetical protein [Streptomyces beihaiensis]|uniref:PPE domain-containing protein n=1 Tax=Streptomyces beihaiensis TaxID=2984495 RepID=A0ABT3TY73_9ACTN|nr:hypothetical protein [Streptomyces beihaiensis]MCX3061770.1 hypothetical protein [Streptomyces beihaiensis]